MNFAILGPRLFFIFLKPFWFGITKKFHEWIKGSNFPFYFQLAFQTHYYNKVHSDLLLPEQVTAYQHCYSLKRAY